MKSKPSLANLLTVLLVAAASATGGWIGRGMFTQRTTAPQATVPPTAEISRAGSSSAASPTSQRSGGVSAEEPKAVAKRLFQALLDSTQEEGSGELLRFRFQQALAGCDEASVAEMMESFMLYAKDPTNRDLVGRGLTWELSDLLMAQMAALNPRKALDYQVGLAQAQVRGGPDGFAMIMELLAEQDPTKVQNVIEGLPSGDIRTSAEMAWWNVRSKTDPEGVFQSLMNLDDDVRDCVSAYPVPLRELLWKLALQAPEKALLAAARFPEAPFFHLQSQLVSAWIDRDPKAAAQWTMEQNNSDMFNAWYQSDVQDVSGLDEKFLRDNFLAIQENMPDSRAGLAQKLAVHLAEQDIPEAIRWAATLPTVEQEAANCGIAIPWIGKDAVGAAEWLATWPKGESRDTMVSLLASQLEKVDPESALTWAGSMQSKERYGLMQKALDTLTEKDPHAAERAMQTLSEEDRAVLTVMKRTGLGK